MKITLRPAFSLLVMLTAGMVLSSCSTAPRQTAEPPPPVVEPDEPVTLFEARSDQQDADRNQDVIRVRESRPKQYTVKKGDTLWDISSLFLKDPWFWPEIWNSNPKIENPHLIYPGDILTLVYIDGRPQILVNQAVPAGARDSLAPTGIRQVKLSPRTSPAYRAMPSASSSPVRAW